ncbi:MAG: response regulator [Anaerolineae bacterium]|nr:response regulator [Anaerolineae bacterium]
MPAQLDDLDLDIIRALQQDGRRSNVEIARDLGVAESTVRKRLDRLLQEQIITIVAAPDLDAVGLPVRTMIFLQVELAHADTTVNQLASLPQVRAVTYTTGEYDLIVDAVFPDNDALLRFLSTQVAVLDSVVKTTTVHVLQDVKGYHQWQLPYPAAPTVLIVDDDPDFVETTRIILEQEGLAVLSASDGGEGLRMMRLHHPELVILDVMMGSLLEGLNATWTIRADQELQHTPVLMVSSIASSEYAESFPTDEYVPVDNFLCKPVAPDKLLKETKRLLQRGKQRRAK